MFKNLNKDLPASIVVFFVAIPLCLGIALASGAPLFSGLIAGIIGGIVVGAISGSSLGVSGPAAGLAAIVLAAITDIGYENLLLAVVIGGIIQVGFGALKAGIIGYYFPSSVIKGMLTGIGIIIILKQIPHFFGYDDDPQGDWAFFQVDGENTFSEIFNAVNNISPGATLIALISISILILWDVVLTKKAKIFRLVQGPLVAVVLGILYYLFTADSSSVWSISPEHLVNVPVPDSFDSFIGQFTTPSLEMIGTVQIWVTGFTIALVASLETLLCVEATDKLDPHRRTTPTNRELFAQGGGNILSGLIGGLPITQVIVRSSANIQSGGQTKMSAILHGFLLLISVIIIPNILNYIPLSVLAAILFIVGYKLAKPALFKQMFQAGWKQFVPFIVTIVGIVFGDLLIGISLGLIVGIVVILIKSYQNSYFLHMENQQNGNKTVKMTLAEEVTFINKGAIIKELNNLEKDSILILDVTKSTYLDSDIIEILDDFKIKAAEKNISIKIISERGVIENPDSYQEFFKRAKKPA
ncbi:SulP family inorganic anion transporter [Autumnicola edwardsiae]|jgi:MFS superfamily sulfate permease-like transporter|uniref:SulP family inorganic anion transporter n=1 Tax=Autumnicola edwardsiae TaxID=3075594 RepID=A0ABU3CSS0_9FLAO|nr:SulP family inorganic anion transporter [Zunongwangia sp. F297]MDT0649418.1 SulP family inorganic anion transporter [Zunongwangia sp. F297]